MSFMLLLCSLTALIERLSSSQIDELNEEKVNVERIRREAKLHEMPPILTRARPNVANRLACFGTAMCNNNIVISMGSNSCVNGSFERETDSNFSN